MTDALDLPPHWAALGPRIEDLLRDAAIELARERARKVGDDS